MKIEQAIKHLQLFEADPSATVDVVVQIRVYSDKELHKPVIIKHGTTLHQYNKCRAENGEACTPCKEVQAAYIKAAYIKIRQYK